MQDRIKTLASFALGIAVLVAFIVAGATLIGGIPWVATKLYPIVVPAVRIAFIIDVLALPLALFRSVRGAVSAVLLVSSYIFGLSIWLYSALVAYILWGYWGLSIGLLMTGVGVVPIAFLASIFATQWLVLLEIVVGVVLTFGARIIAVLLASHS